MTVDALSPGEFRYDGYIGIAYALLKDPRATDDDGQ
jgi:hypothetical protein